MLLFRGILNQWFPTFCFVSPAFGYFRIIGPTKYDKGTQPGGVVFAWGIWGLVGSGGIKAEKAVKAC